MLILPTEIKDRWGKPESSLFLPGIPTSFFPPTLNIRHIELSAADPRQLA